MNKKHSVTLDVDKCKGCTTCLHNCPTKAIRVRNGKAVIIQDKCIDCGECIRVCPNNAKAALTDTLEDVQQYSVKVALVPPSLMGQFSAECTVGEILSGILQIGFDYVYEAAYGAEILGKIIPKELKKNPDKLFISSACPTIVRLIQEEFPLLAENIIQLKAPIHVTAEKIRQDFKAKGYSDEDIGIFFLTPCAAKATEIFNEPNEKGKINGAVSVKDVVWELQKNKIELTDNGDTIHSYDGIRWAVSGGESAKLDQRTALHVNGISNVIKVLEDIENGKLRDIHFLEMLACVEGCVGGCLTVENPFVAKNRVLLKVQELKDSETQGVVTQEYAEALYENGELSKGPFQATEAKPLDPDRAEALRKLNLIEEQFARLPGYDCGSCGAPGCRAHAEDIVMGHASEMDCIFMLKDAITKLSKDMLEVSQKVTPIMHSDETENIGGDTKQS